MERTINKNLCIFLNNALWICVCVISALILPQLFHAFGIISGSGEKFGQMFLPMYLPVLILAFKTNPFAGVIAGILSPIISFSISGMPTAAMLPLITIELACFGLFAGLIKDKKWNIFAKIFTIQLLSRIVRIMITLISVYFISDSTVTANTIFSGIILSIPGFVMQLLVVPYFVNKRCFK